MSYHSFTIKEINQSSIFKETGITKVESNLTTSSQETVEVHPCLPNKRVELRKLGRNCDIKKTRIKIWGHLRSLGGGVTDLTLPTTAYDFDRNTRVSPYKTQSRNHVVIKLLNTNPVYVSDLRPVIIDKASRNGTLVNGMKIPVDRKIPLYSRDTIVISYPVSNHGASMGPLAFTFYLPEYTSLDLEFKLGHCLNRTYSESVNEVLQYKTGRFFVVKFLKKLTQYKRKNNYSKLREIGILKRVSHPSLVKILNVYESPSELGLVFKLAPYKTLSSLIFNDEPLSSNQVFRLSYQVLSALRHLHQNLITHRDITPEHILIFRIDPLIIQITGFSKARVFKRDELMFTEAGTRNYLAPEACPSINSDGYNEKVDLWSLGAILFQSYASEVPFAYPYHNLDDSTILLRLEEVKHHMKYHAWLLLRRLLAFNPKDRVSAEEALDSSYISHNLVLAQDLIQAEFDHANFHGTKKDLKFKPQDIPT